MKISHRWLAVGMILFLTNCVSLTVNVYFPTEKIQQAAEEIEERVRSGEGVEGLSLAPFFNPQPQKYAVAFHFGAKTAYAQNVDIEIKNPAIRAIIQSRAERYKKLLAYYENGMLGEGLDAYLVLRSTSGLDLKAMTEVKKLVQAENKDRKDLYEAILKANNQDVNEENTKRVQELFFNAIKDKMKVGHWYQVKKDEWTQKKEEQKA